MSVEDRTQRHRGEGAARRRVRTTSGGSRPRPVRPKRPVTINVGGSKRHRRVGRRSKGLAVVVWAVLSLALLIVGLLMQITLALVAAGLTALASAATALIPDDLGTHRPAAPVNPPSRPRTGRSRPPRRASARRPAAQVVRCRETGTSITECGCARRHVATADGARRYGRPVGSPIPVAGKPS